MTKKEILEKANIQGLDVLTGNGLVLIYYIGRLKELNLVSGGPDITTKGFDLALDLLELGWIITDEELDAMKSSFAFIGFSEILTLVKRLQTLGYDTMKKEVEELKLTNDELS